MISILMSLYNEQKHWIIDSIDSILNQTFKQFEFIIINDNPENEELRILLNEYSKNDKRIILIKNKLNIGLTMSLNLGLAIAKGKYIARMDADDISLPNRLADQFAFMEANPLVFLCGSNIIKFNNNKEFKVNLPKESLNIKSTLFLENCMCHPTFFFRNNKNIKKYDERFKYSQDYKFLVDNFEHGDFFNLDSYLLKYRISPNQISRKKLKEQDAFGILIRKELFKKITKTSNFDLINYLDILKQDKDFLHGFMLLSFCDLNKNYKVITSLVFKKRIAIKVYLKYFKGRISKTLKKKMFSN
jgi:glycosyltransferase involved in cell wall biosynthesis